MEAVEKRVEYWKQRLVDLSKRNRLIYFQPGTRSSLRLLRPAPDQVFERLVVDEGTWRIWQPPAEETPPRQGDPAPQRARVATDPLARRPPGPDELVCADMQAQSLDRTLRNLHRRALTDFEERGLRVLHIACGFLQWSEAEAAEPVRSPLILLPVVLEADGLADRYRLLTCEEDPVVNPALQVKLSRDFRLTLPPAPEAWEQASLTDYLDAVRAAVAALGWSVSAEAWLGVFSFHKLVMYEDLERNLGPVAAHPLVRALSGDAAARESLRGEPASTEGLDDELDLRDVFLIRDADASQLACLRAVRAGRHLVVHGPPGTGKSQTITNIIADAIGHGRSVLFVSEKMAALDVVRQRLGEGGLGHFVLELHSQKANKREVVAELYRCLRQQVRADGGMTDLQYAQLGQRRQRLNDYVQALHTVREPFGESARQVLARLAQLADTPLFIFTYPDADRLTPQGLTEATDLASRLALVWHVAREGEAFPWRGHKARTWSTSLRDRIQHALREAGGAVAELVRLSQGVAGGLDLPAPEDLAGTRWLADLVGMLASTPGIELGWLAADRSALRRRTETCRRRQEGHQSRRAALVQRRGEAFVGADRGAEARLRALCRQLDAALGRESLHEVALVPLRHRLRDFAAGLGGRLADWERDAGALAGRLGLPAGPWTAVRLEQLVDLTRRLCSADIPDARWLGRPGREAAEALLPRRRDDYRQLAALRADLTPRYRLEELAELDLSRLAPAFAGAYRSPLRLLRPTYHADRRGLRACCRQAELPPTLAADLETARQWKELRGRLRAAEEADRAVLGRQFRGADTDFDALARGLLTAAPLRALIWTDAVPPPIEAICRGERELSTEVAQEVRRLEEDLRALCSDAETLREVLPEARLPISRLPLSETELPRLAAWAEQLARDAAALCTEVDPLLAGGRANPTLAALADDLGELSALQAIEYAVAEENQELARTFGGRVNGLATPWAELDQALLWTQRLCEHFGERTIPEAVRAIAGASAPAPPAEPIAAGVAAAAQALEAVLRDFTPGCPRIGGRPLGELPLAALPAALDGLGDRLDALRDWMDYGAIRQQLAECGLGGLVTAMENNPPEAADLPRVVAKAMLQAWIDALYARVPALGAFRGDDHGRIIAEFRALDGQHATAGAYRVIREASRNRPDGVAALAGSEVDVLQTEANKSRRHLPLRRLFAKIPNLLPRLKPVLLMSPITVSQFLSLGGLTFDLLVFDEASQICSEDAVGAIYRSHQVVICGDQKQLPPTAFFEESGEDDEGDAEEEDPASTDFESVLDECLSFSLPSGTLRWHYRSRDESLIAFSNKFLYGGELVTFPSPDEGLPGFGLRFDLVADGMYERGTTRVNRREAARVAELVLEHVRGAPDKSLGVIAFSAAQAEAIEAAVVALRRDHPEHEEFFAQERLRGFFVKNIENVQGDERDAIILSVGYGRDGAGRLTMNFGPLNGAGGERRLNVAVTRAMERLTLVSSIRAGDMADSDRPGVQLLRRYLDFAERGRAALELDGSSGDPESPLEASVAGTIRALGYEVVHQVGCSGFRIDLGVRDPDMPGRFLLGVECDGRTYHSSATAGDRDRLRQEVLTRLGWKLHRIWSSEWVLRRDAETARLREALAHARADGHRMRPTAAPPTGAPPAVRLVEVEVEAPEPEAGADWQRPYAPASPALPWGAPGRAVLDEPGRLVPLVLQVVQAEGPVHVDVLTRRVAEACGAQRAGSRIQESIRLAVSTAVGGRAIALRDSFLWSPGVTSLASVRVPVADDPRTRRLPEQIPWEEYAVALCRLARQAVGIAPQALVVQVARVFGFDRTGVHVATAIEDALGRCLQAGLLREQGGSVVAALGDDQELARPQAPTPPARERNGTAMSPAAVRGSAAAQPEAVSDGSQIEQLLRRRGLEIIDKRPEGGRLWVIAGPEVRELMSELRGRGLRFVFAGAGGRATDRRPAWWLASTD